MAVSSDVIVRLRAVGQAAFTGAMNEAAGSLGKVDTQAKKADKSTGAATDQMGKGGSRLKGSVKSLAMWAGGAAAVAGGARALKGAVTATMDLGKSTMMLQRQTGMSAETASAWGEVLKVRGVDTKQFGVGMTKLSKQMTATGPAGQKAMATFQKLGVSMDAVKSGDINSVLLQTADAYSKMTNPAEKAATMQSLFGKQAQNLAPIMSAGSAGIQEQLTMAQKYGATLSGTGAQGVKDMVARQRELQMASDGIKVSLGTALMPVILSLSQSLVSLVAIMQPLLRSGTAVKVMLALLTTAFITLKVATIASTIAAFSFNAALLLIPLAIVALIAGLVIAYHKVGWFHDAVNAAASAVKNALVAAYNWVRTHWVLLASILGGPFVAAAIQIAKHWSQIKAGAASAVASIKRTVGSLPGAFLSAGRSLVTHLVNGIKSTPNAVLDAIKSLLPGKLAGKVGDALGLWAHGGVVPHAQWGIVGERGPELLQLPGGTRITPLTAPSMAAPTLDEGGGGPGRAQTTAHFYLDRRLVASAVAQDTADTKARR